MSARSWSSASLSVLVLAACGTERSSRPLEPVATATVVTSVPGVDVVEGETGRGSYYALFRPPVWNAELVVYVHGYVQPHQAPGIPEPFPPIRDYLLSQGFAVAYSHFSETGYFVKDAAQRTHQLLGLFGEAFTEPGRVYLVGASMGGLAAELLSERFGPQYDGTLVFCGVVAGGPWNAAYVADFRLLFDHFYPGVLPGSLYAMPQGYRVEAGSPAYNAILGALATNPLPAVEMAGMDQIGLPFANVTELITGFIHVLGYQVNGANALFERLHGHGFFDNTGIWYSGSADDDAVNAGIARYAADPAGRNYMAHWWDPEGRIGGPFVTLHTTRDPLVPVRSEDVFRARVEAAGHADLLLQREVEAFGHCAFQPTDILGAFHALVDWVRTGVKPAG